MYATFFEFCCEQCGVGGEDHLHYIWGRKEKIVPCFGMLLWRICKVCYYEWSTIYLTFNCLKTETLWPIWTDCSDKFGINFEILITIFCVCVPWMFLFRHLKKRRIKCDGSILESSSASGHQKFWNLKKKNLGNPMVPDTIRFTHVQLWSWSNPKCCLGFTTLALDLSIRHTHMTLVRART